MSCMTRCNLQQHRRMARRWKMEIGCSEFMFKDELMYLPLDFTVSDYVLRRRKAISFGSSTGFASRPRLGRRGGVSYDQQDETAIYVRMLGDVRMKSKPDRNNDGRRKSLSESDVKLLDKLSSKETKLQLSSRFLSLHKCRQRRRPAVCLSQQNVSLLDTQYQRQAECLLSSVGSWNFDIFSLDLLTCGRPLLYIALNIFRQYDLINTFNLDIMKIFRVFSLIEDGYHSSNPYHNAVHAADVTQAMHCYLQEKELQGSIPPFEIMTSLLAAMTHDLDHPGVNQTFLIATANHLAALYKNTSVLENHHWRSSIAILQQSGVFNHFTKELWEQVVWQLKSLILATDITRQQEFLSRFKKFLDDGNFDCQNNIEHRHFMLQIALKCADISNPCRSWPVSKLWSERVCDEFFRQGDYERRLQIPVTPLCDRHSTTFAKIQAGFMQFVVVPLFQEWQRFLPTPLSAQMVKNVHLNLEQWKIIISEEEIEKQKFEVENETESNEELNENDSNEIVSIAAADEENDTVDEDRLPLTFVHLLDDQENLSYNGSRRGSIRSLSPVKEEPDALLLEQRRHSMPLYCLQKEVTNITVHRDTLPLTQYLRRRSLPTAMILHATSLERLTDKLSALASERVTLNKKSTSMEELLTRPKISNLSPSFEASRLASGLLVTSSQPSPHGNIIRFLSKRRKLPSQNLPQSEDEDSDCVISEDSDSETNDVQTFPKEALVNITQFSVPSRILTREATPPHPSFNCVNNLEHDRVVNKLHEGVTNMNELNIKGNSSVDKMTHVEATDFDSGLIPPDISKNVPNAVSPASLSQ